MGFQPITFSQLLGIDKQDRKAYVVLTFDDGLLDNFENAVPILNEFGYPATFFVIPGFDSILRWVNPKTRAWSESKRPGFTIPFPSMQQHHRRELAESDMEIGCHTMNHPSLNKTPSDRLDMEIVASKALLEDQLGMKITSFCYPKGRYNRSVLEKVEQAGYRGACTTMPGYYSPSTPKFECGRFLVESPELFQKILRWAHPACQWTETFCALLRIPLKFKNVYL